MLAGKVAIVTGAARGIGLAIATSFCENGASVLLADMDGSTCSEVVEQLRSRGLTASAFTADLSVASQTQALADAAPAIYGGLDILVNNAGGSASSPINIEDITEEHFDRVFAWNVRSAFFCTKSALPHMRTKGGAIINMAASAGRAGRETTSPHYSAAKAGIIGLTRNLAKHLGPLGIRVNVIAPGYIDSGPRATALWEARGPEQILKSIALGRRGRTDEIAQTALFLASSNSSYITGAVMDVNGGFLCL